MKGSILSIFAVAAAVNAAKVISTRYETEVITITACPDYVTACPAKVTSKVHTYTTECEEEKTYPTATATYVPVVHTKYPLSNGTAYVPYTTKTLYETKVYTITSCAPTVTNCPYGSVTSTVIASTTVCPVETGYPVPSSTDEHIPYTTAPVDTHYPTGLISTVTISTCVPSYVTKVITVTAGEPYPTKPAGEAPPPSYPGVTTVPYGNAPPAVPTGGYAVPVTNQTVEYTGSASSQRAGGLLIAVGLAVALL